MPPPLLPPMLLVLLPMLSSLRAAAAQPTTAPALRGCTVPTARNYNASASLDDGSCVCETRRHPSGYPCLPSSVVVPRGNDGSGLCPSARPLPCMLCDTERKNCIYQCETADGSECSKVALETFLHKLQEVVTQEVNLSLCIVLTVTICVSVAVQTAGWRWLQESMAWILLGMCLGLGVHAYARWCSAGDAATAEEFFAQHIEFKGWVFFYCLLPPIIADAGYNMRRGRFFRNFDRILMLSTVGTLVSTLAIGAALFFLDFGRVLPAASDPHNGQPWEALQFGALLSATDPVASLSVLSSMAQVRVQIIRHARTHYVGKYQSCMF